MSVVPHSGQFVALPNDITFKLLDNILEHYYDIQNRNQARGLRSL